jgi:hypothetical protein
VRERRKRGGKKQKENENRVRERTTLKDELWKDDRNESIWETLTLPCALPLTWSWFPEPLL